MSLLPIPKLIAQATYSRGSNSIDFRELIIASKDSGYVILYPHEPADDAVYTLDSSTRIEAVIQMVVNQSSLTPLTH